MRLWMGVGVYSLQGTGRWIPVTSSLLDRIGVRAMAGARSMCSVLETLGLTGGTTAGLGGLTVVRWTSLLASTARKIEHLANGEKVLFQGYWTTWKCNCISTYIISCELSYYFFLAGTFLAERELLLLPGSKNPTTAGECWP